MLSNNFYYRSLQFLKVILIIILLGIIIGCSGSKSVSDDPYRVILTPKPSLKPRINGPSIFGVRPGSPFLYTIPVTGKRPMKYVVENLPDGLMVNSENGQITGSIKEKGEYVVIFKASNELGSAEKKFKIVCGDKIALTPHMGWNHWYIWENFVTEKQIREAADAMVKNDMINHGYSYINIDDCWSVKPGSEDPTLSGEPRDKDGKINSNKRFPDMKALTDYIHSKGLKAGIYTSPGDLTCGLHIAAYKNEEKDVQRFVEWGFDFLKYDLCSYRKLADCKNIDELKKPYGLIGEIIKKQPRDIVLNFCEYGWGEVWKWGRALGANNWRTAGDLGGKHDEIVKKIYRDGFDLYADNDLHKYAGPGGWNDPDYLLLNTISDWKGNPVPTPLDANEQYTQVSFWSIIAAPLIFSGDINNLDEFTLSLLTNDEVIEVNQDALGKPGRRITRIEDAEVWCKELEDGSKAVGLFNRGEDRILVKVNWIDIGSVGKLLVRDLWRQKDLGEFEDRFSAFVPPHGVIFIRVFNK